MATATGYFGDIYAALRGKLTDPAREHDGTYKYPPNYPILEGPGSQDVVLSGGTQVAQAEPATTSSKRRLRGRKR